MPLSGFKARKEVSEKKKDAAAAAEVPDEEQGAEAAEEIDIDLEDPEVEAAAAKIQAGACRAACHSINRLYFTAASSSRCVCVLGERLMTFFH